MKNMYSPEERKSYFDTMIEKIQTSDLVEGIVQIGSGVTGYSDEYSDVDLMVATSRTEDAEPTKDVVREFFTELHPIYIKEKQFGKDIFLLIVVLENKLEFNVSIVPRELLTVKSPLWKVLVDKTGLVAEKMNQENKNFISMDAPYDVGFDVPFEFVYCAMSLEKALKRNNVIYALKMLETMRTYTLLVQAMNEDKKLHQFKAYDSLNPSFIKSYLSTYPERVDPITIDCSAKKLIGLFEDVVEQHSTFSMDEHLHQLLNKTLV
ncbi:aminoglycoside 6-adenylyltransferase [Bacillus sp. HNG]|uniref:aminoglycoside 6-adenylyltransferase n=1 Tax=Bacillus sp. HNG TaxID=2293325 RepID=UPI001674E972|nr:aminoglycoside 6-adenylyltransferase [Bacillus sp. HNG]